MYAFIYDKYENCFLRKSPTVISNHLLPFPHVYTWEVFVLSYFMNQSFLNIRGRALLSRDSTKIVCTLVFNVANSQSACANIFKILDCSDKLLLHYETCHCNSMPVCLELSLCLPSCEYICTFVTLFNLSIYFYLYL